MGERLAVRLAALLRAAPPHFARLGEPDQGPMIEAFLRARGTTASEIIIRLVTSAGARERLLASGLGDDDLRQLRLRLVE